MRFLILGLAALAVSGAASAQVHVKGYVNKNGTYVAPHYRSSPDSTTSNNWSTRGNVNPYTGQPGTKSPTPSPWSSSTTSSSNSSGNSAKSTCSSSWYC